MARTGGWPFFNLQLNLKIWSASPTHRLACSTTHGWYPTEPMSLGKQCWHFMWWHGILGVLYFYEIWNTVSNLLLDRANHIHYIRRRGWHVLQLGSLTWLHLFHDVPAAARQCFGHHVTVTHPSGWPGNPLWIKPSVATLACIVFTTVLGELDSV